MRIRAIVEYQPRGKRRNASERSYRRGSIGCPCCSHTCNKSCIWQVHGTQFISTLILACITWLRRCCVININLNAYRPCLLSMSLWHILSFVWLFGDGGATALRWDAKWCEKPHRLVLFLPLLDPARAHMFRQAKICLTGTVFFNARFRVR